MRKLFMVTIAEAAVAIAVSSGLLISCKDNKVAVEGKTYETMTLMSSSKSLYSRYTATLRGRQDVEIRPQVSDTITQVCTIEGAQVGKGETLFVIDQVPYEAALKTAIAQVEVARSEVSTARLTAESKTELFRQNIVSSLDKQLAENTWHSQQASLSLAEAQEVNARNNLSYTVVKSPVDGTAGMMPFRVGALVGPTMTTPLPPYQTIARSMPISQ